MARIAWAAAVCGIPALAETCAARAAAAQELGPRGWADLTRVALALALGEARMPEGAQPPGSKGGCSMVILQTGPVVCCGDRAIALSVSAG